MRAVPPAHHQASWASAEAVLALRDRGDGSTKDFPRASRDLRPRENRLTQPPCPHPARLRDTTEQVFNGVSFVLMAYLLMGLGIPAIRVLYEVRLCEIPKAPQHWF